MSTGMMGQTIWSADANSTNVGLFLFAKMVSGDKFDRAAGAEVTVGTFNEVNGTTTPASVVIDGVGKITLAGTLAAGAIVESDSVGKAVAHSAGYIAGVLLKGGVSGDIVPIKLS